MNGEAQARHALSAVAGLFRENGPTRPDSERAAAAASLMAKNAALPRKTAGSPMPCRERSRPPPGSLETHDDVRESEARKHKHKTRPDP